MEITKTSLYGIGTSILKGYYKLDDTSDSSGNSNTLTNNNSVTFDAGLFGNCADFGSSNTNKYLNTSNTLGIASNTPQTYSCWAKVTTQPGANITTYILNQAENTGKTQAQIGYKDSSGTKQVFFAHAINGVAGNAITINQTLTTGVWYHLAYTYDGGTSAKAYINGILVGTLTTSGTTGNSNVGTPGFLIGVDGNSLTNFFSGLVDDVAVFTVVLTPQQIAEIYNTDATTLGLSNTNSLRFYTAQSERVVITDNADFHPSTFTIETWIKNMTTPAASNYPTIFGSLNDAGSHGINFFMDGDASGKFRCAVAGTTSVNAVSNTVPPINQWCHLAATV